MVWFRKISSAAITAYRQLRELVRMDMICFDAIVLLTRREKLSLHLDGYRSYPKLPLHAIATAS